MLILAHRGLWREAAEQNSLAALQRALVEGFGVETDIRDCAGQLVISHDPPLAGAIPFAAFLDEYSKLGSSQMLALNIKADGLTRLLADALGYHRITREQYFVFDMPPPDARQYLQLGMPCFTRQSEIEPIPAFIDEASGIWLDCFAEDWINADVIEGHCRAGRMVGLVSPELHGRDWQAAWKEWRKAYRDLQRQGFGQRIMICTDHPREARAYFNAAD